MSSWAGRAEGSRPSCHPERSEPKASGVEGSPARRMALVACGRIAPTHSLLIAQSDEEKTSNTTNCASGDSQPARLTCRRQPAHQTDAPATRRGRNRAPAVADGRIWFLVVAGRRFCPPPPARLCIRRQHARQTVPPATDCTTNCASGDSPRDKLCIRRLRSG